MTSQPGKPLVNKYLGTLIVVREREEIGLPLFDSIACKIRSKSGRPLSWLMVPTYK